MPATIPSSFANLVYYRLSKTQSFHPSVIMETPLSPRSSNIPSKHPATSKGDSGSKRTLTKEEAAQAKAAADRKAEKDKNHASPPPEYVIQPPGPDGVLGEKYHTGKLLGKGGFAICYEGRLVGQKYAGKNPKFALKIVKAKMGMKKMEEKVCS